MKNGTIPVGKTKFCDDYGKYVAMSAITNHLEHKPGDRCEVDWSGPTMSFTNPDTGEAITVYLFVGCLTYSRYAYVEPTLDMLESGENNHYGSGENNQNLVKRK